MAIPASTADQKLHISQTLPKSQLEENDKNDLTQTQTQTQTQTDSKPNKTPKTGIACRSIKCVGKVLLGVFTVPAMAVLVTLSGFVSGVASACHTIISATSKRGAICAFILLVTITPPCALLIGGLGAIAGVFYGIGRGVQIARDFSTKPLEKTWTETKGCLLGKASKEVEKSAQNLKQGYQIASALHNELKKAEQANIRLSKKR